jgi:hypothetical protein
MVKFQGLLLLCVGLLIPMISLASEEGQGHRHHVAVFVGATHADGTDEPTVGAHYEYLVTPKIGVGALVDHTGGDLDSTIVAAALGFHPHAGWTLIAAAGNENTNHGDEFIARAGIGYEFELNGSWSLTPQLNFDFVKDRGDQGSLWDQHRQGLLTLAYPTNPVSAADRVAYSPEIEAGRPRVLVHFHG